MHLYNTHPQPPLSLDLIALSILTPPSPILSPTHLTTTWSWSEIHVELDFDADETDEAVAERPPISAHASDSTVGLGIISSSSVSTVGTVGTFGPIRRRDKPQDTGCWSPNSPRFEERSTSRLSANEVFETFCPPARASQSIPISLNQECCDQGLANASKLVMKTSAFPYMNYTSATGDKVLPASISDESSSSHLRRASLYLDSRTKKEDNSSCQTLHDLEILPFFAPPSLQPSESCPTAGRSNAQTALIHEDSPVNALTRQLAFAAALATLESKCYSVPSSPQRAQASISCDTQQSKRSLPKSLAWLANTVVEVLIDQEGFRAVLARFKHTGYVGAGSQPNSHEHGTAQFRPTHRQIFNFHYAPLDSLPILRRITVNGEESRDYTSRQASLGLKANGVYFVRGNETLSFPMPHTPGEETPSESAKLRWRFEYMVDDRRVDASGKKIVDGEKTLTPLSFSCSPLLLHPLQGKRIRLMHVVKKSVIAKLAAEKMEPPGLRSLTDLPAIGTTRATKRHIQPAAAQLLAKSQAYGWNLHKRSATHCTPRYNGEEHICAGLPASPMTNSAPQEKIGAHLSRRRRASSAGERSRPGDDILSPYVHLPLQGNSSLSRNIIPRSRLAALLAMEGSQDNTAPPLVTISPSHLSRPSFHPLSPSPRHHHLPIKL
ncbi:hypothetical protein FPV67DRAFT_1466870 [Lyophyllum atratum]|nr:hypothetical protein FPV67DRAFT_1466870 [Lyophyllum atratum]